MKRWYKIWHQIPRKERNASHNNFSPEPQFPNFFVRTTSNSSAFQWYFILEDKNIFLFWPRLGMDEIFNFCKSKKIASIKLKFQWWHFQKIMLNNIGRTKVSRWFGRANEENVARTRNCCSLPSSPNPGAPKFIRNC